MDYNPKKWIRYGLLLVTASFLVFGYFKIRPSVQDRIYAQLKCPDDYATENEQMAAVDLWTNEFYDQHPGATLSGWSAARHKFWVDNNCTAALKRYEEAKALSK